MYLDKHEQTEMVKVDTYQLKLAIDTAFLLTAKYIVDNADLSKTRLDQLDDHSKPINEVICRYGSSNQIDLMSPSFKKGELTDASKGLITESMVTLGRVRSAIHRLSKRRAENQAEATALTERIVKELTDRFGVNDDRITTLGLSSGDVAIRGVEGMFLGHDTLLTVATSEVIKADITRYLKPSDLTGQTLLALGGDYNTIKRNLSIAKETLLALSTTDYTAQFERCKNLVLIRNEDDLKKYIDSDVVNANEEFISNLENTPMNIQGNRVSTPILGVNTRVSSTKMSSGKVLTWSATSTNQDEKFRVPKRLKSISWDQLLDLSNTTNELMQLSSSLDAHRALFMSTLEMLSADMGSDARTAFSALEEMEKDPALEVKAKWAKESIVTLGLDVRSIFIFQSQIFDFAHTANKAVSDFYVTVRKMK